MNNTPDYKNDIVFKPELKWEDLCEYAESKGATVNKDSFLIKGLVFCKNGAIGYMNSIMTISRNRSYEQMKTIIEALWG